MTPAFDYLVQRLRKLPGLGYRSAERIALHLLVEKPDRLPDLIAALNEASTKLQRCTRCGNLAESDLCELCADEKRDGAVICVVEQVPDLIALERSGSYRGTYHVLYGKLSPIHGVGPDDLNVGSLLQRIDSGDVREVILAVSNDVEGEATCHFISERIAAKDVKLSRIGFGLPSGGGVLYADSTTLKSALDARREYL